jgi:high-affinity nickel-transport protein
MQRGLINRVLGGRLQKLMNHSWQMYPLGLLSGIGFDTTSEVGRLAMTAGTSAGDLPIGAILTLPILFAAGMSVMDTTDGVLMSKAYNRAFLYRSVGRRRAPHRDRRTVAGVRASYRPAGDIFDGLRVLDFNLLGHCIVGLFLFGWALSVAVWKFGRLEERGDLWTSGAAAHAPVHEHGDGLTHSHPHLH